MADNYLEKQMEDYISAQNKKKRTSNTRQRSKRILSGKKICFFNPLNDDDINTIKNLIIKGASISVFSDINNVSAQKSAGIGARFYPIDLHNEEDIKNKIIQMLIYYLRIDLIITVKDSSGSLTELITKTYNEYLNTLPIQQSLLTNNQIINVESISSEYNRIIEKLLK